MSNPKPRIELPVDRETAWTIRRFLLRFHRGAEHEYGRRELTDTEDRRRRLEYALADDIEGKLLGIMHANGWAEEDDAP